MGARRSDGKRESAMGRVRGRIDDSCGICGVTNQDKDQGKGVCVQRLCVRKRESKGMKWFIIVYQVGNKLFCLRVIYKSKTWRSQKSYIIGANSAEVSRRCKSRGGI